MATPPAARDPAVPVPDADCEYAQHVDASTKELRAERPRNLCKVGGPCCCMIICFLVIALKAHEYLDQRASFVERSCLLVSKKVFGRAAPWMTDQAKVDVLVQGETAPRWIGRHRNEHSYNYYGCLWRFTLCNMQDDTREAWLDTLQVNTTVPCYQFA